MTLGRNFEEGDVLGLLIEYSAIAVGHFTDAVTNRCKYYVPLLIGEG